MSRRDSETRLVYSTGGETPAEKPPAKKRSAEETPGHRPSPAGGHGVRLRLDRRASGRVVTLVSGLPGSPAEVLDLARVLKAACGAGGTVKDGILELQGDHRERVESALAARRIRSKRAGG